YYAILAALIHVGNGESVPDATTLASESNCLMCVIAPGMVPYAIIAAIRGISTGGGGGSGGVLRTTGNPEGVLVAASANSVAYDCSSGAFYVFCGTAGTNVGWQPLIGP